MMSFTHEGKILLYNICRINKKAQIMMSVSQTVFHKVHNVSHNLTTHKIECFSSREFKVVKEIASTGYYVLYLYQVMMPSFINIESNYLNNSVFA